MTRTDPRLAAGPPVPAALPCAAPVAQGNPVPPQAIESPSMRGGAGPQAPRTWAIELPPGTQLLTMNQRQHHMAAAKLTKTLRETTGWLARAQHIPRLEAAAIVCELTVPDRRRRDPANWMPTAKACVDGLVDAGVLDDDDFLHVRGPDMRLNVAAHRERYGRGGVFTVSITELDGPL